MLAAPAPSPFDLNFRLLGIPVRIHPMFWLISAALGWSSRDGLPNVLLWVPCVFLSILVHEYGHGLMARALGFDAWIVLYGMGGLCYSEGERQRPWQRLLVLFSGPGAGFVLGGLTIIGFITSVLMGVDFREHEAANRIIDNLVRINFLWGLVNLVPLWPLDGGQISGVILTKLSPTRGMFATHILSMFTAAVLAILAVRFVHDVFLTIFFAYFGLINFQFLQSR
jgi:stage IV sporulation protein FB